MMPLMTGSACAAISCERRASAHSWLAAIRRGSSRASILADGFFTSHSSGDLVSKTRPVSKNAAPDKNFGLVKETGSNNLNLKGEIRNPKGGFDETAYEDFSLASGESILL